MPANGSKRELAVTIYGLLAGMGLPKDVVVVTPDEVVRYGNVVGYSDSSQGGESSV
jgi:hypothetical protein